jgi:hypothetical protein
MKTAHPSKYNSLCPKILIKANLQEKLQMIFENKFRKTEASTFA